MTSGDNVVVYATFPKDTLILKSTMRQLLTPAQLAKFSRSRRAAPPLPACPW